MEASSRGVVAGPHPLSVEIRRTIGPCILPVIGLGIPRRRRIAGGIRCSGPDPERRSQPLGVDMSEEWRRTELKRRVRTRAMPAVSFPSRRSQGYSKQKNLYPRCIPKNSAPQSRDTPPKRVRRNGESTCWMKMSRNLAQMKMVAHGTGKVEMTWGIMGTDVAGQGWEDNIVMDPRNGRKLTDKWAETEVGTRWGDKWEEKFFAGIGSREGETWHVSPTDERWSRTWGEEHFSNGKVHKYGKSTTGESWDIVVDEATYYEAEPHYGWAEVVGDSSQLLSIQPRDRPPGVYPSLDFGSSPLLNDLPPDAPPSSL